MSINIATVTNAVMCKCVDYKLLTWVGNKRSFGQKENGLCEGLSGQRRKKIEVAKSRMAGQWIGIRYTGCMIE